MPIVRGIDWIKQELTASELLEIGEAASRVGCSGSEVIHRRGLGLADDGSPLSAEEQALREGEAAARRLQLVPQGDDDDTKRVDVAEGAGDDDDDDKDKGGRKGPKRTR